MLAKLNGFLVLAALVERLKTLDVFKLLHETGLTRRDGSFLGSLPYLGPAQEVLQIADVTGNRCQLQRKPAPAIEIFCLIERPQSLLKLALRFKDGRLDLAQISLSLRIVRQPSLQLLRFVDSRKRRCEISVIGQSGRQPAERDHVPVWLAESLPDLPSPMDLLDSLIQPASFEKDPPQAFTSEPFTISIEFSIQGGKNAQGLFETHFGRGEIALSRLYNAHIKKGAGNSRCVLRSLSAAQHFLIGLSRFSPPPGLEESLGYELGVVGALRESLELFCDDG
ncbi:MAG TPA: hypothetical protein VGS07_18800 [Thermoanaerobaculia bacterium]|nr:hypothetical protein [Thermoanaerobaculia bacterium]